VSVFQGAFLRLLESARERFIVGSGGDVEGFGGSGASGMEMRDSRGRPEKRSNMGETSSAYGRRGVDRCCK
jgi:hypothetical protein